MRFYIYDLNIRTNSVFELRLLKASLTLARFDRVSFPIVINIGLIECGELLTSKLVEDMLVYL